MRIISEMATPAQQLVGRQLPVGQLAPFGLTVPVEAKLISVSWTKAEGVVAWFLVPTGNLRTTVVYLLIVPADGSNLPSVSAASFVATVGLPTGAIHVFEVLGEYLIDFTTADYEFLGGSGWSDLVRGKAARKTNMGEH